MAGVAESDEAVLDARRFGAYHGLDHRGIGSERRGHLNRNFGHQAGNPRNHVLASKEIVCRCQAQRGRPIDPVDLNGAGRKTNASVFE